MVTIEVIYANPETQKMLTIQIPSGATVLDAIKQSGILKEFPEIDLERNKVGLFGEFTTLSHVLRDRDRIEIYRPLRIDPKQARLNRVKQEKGHPINPQENT